MLVEDIYTTGCLATGDSLYFSPIIMESLEAFTISFFDKQVLSHEDQVA